MANMCRQDKAHTYPLIIQQKAKPKIHNRTKPRLAKYGEETQHRKTEQENCTLMGSVSLLFYFIFFILIVPFLPTLLNDILRYGF
jgi:hypothetical protein